MLKRKIDNYIKHYYETTRNALLITGARQIGKTYSIREFGKTFKSFVEINFIESLEAGRVGFRYRIRRQSLAHRSEVGQRLRNAPRLVQYHGLQ